MVSKKRATYNKRCNKRAKMGKKRKAQDRNKGTTPKFKIHLDKA